MKGYRTWPEAQREATDGEIFLPITCPHGSVKVCHSKCALLEWRPGVDKVARLLCSPRVREIRIEEIV